MSRYKDSNIDNTDFEEYIDVWGLIVTGEGDGGDTCANQFTYHYCMMHTSAPPEPRIASLSRSLQLLTGPGGIPIRHPANRFGDWAARTQATSRDQFTCYLIALIAYQDANRLDALVRAHARRLFVKAWNVVSNGQRNVNGPHKAADITGPDIWALWIRALRLWPLYPILCILDAHNFAAVVLDVLWYNLATKPASLPARLLRWLLRKPTGWALPLPDKDQRNLALKAHASATYMPTPLSLAAMRLYSQSALPRYGFTAFWKHDINEPPMHTVMLRLIYGK